MNTSHAVRNASLAATLVLSGGLAGCMHHHSSTTQMASTTMATTVAAASSSHDAADTAAKPQSSVGSKISSAGTETGHVAGEAARDTGHVAAVAGRETGHAFMQAGRATGEIFTSSAVGLHNSPPESLSAPSIDVDEAMQARDWNLTPAYYPSGSTVAGPTEFAFVPAPNQPQERAVIVEPALFFVNLAVMPIEIIRCPPWTAVQWKAASVEPTYTAVPPLPPEDKP